MNKSESIEELAKALSGFQKEVKQPSKNGYNPHFKSKYVTLDDTIKAINETAPKYGLSYLQMPISDDNHVGSITVIMHSSGQYIEFPPFMLPMGKNTAQGAGSSLTYARRYSISAAFGLVSDEDDDGNSASQKKESKDTKKQTPNREQAITPNTIGLIKTKWLESGLTEQQLNTRIKQVYKCDMNDLTERQGIELLEKIQQKESA